MCTKPQILEVLDLMQDLPTNLEMANHPFLVENHGLELGGTDFHQMVSLYIYLENNSVFAVNIILFTKLNMQVKTCPLLELLKCLVDLF